MILARWTKTNARRQECVIEEINAKISLTLEAECKIAILTWLKPHRQSKLFAWRTSMRQVWLFWVNLKNGRKFPKLSSPPPPPHKKSWLRPWTCRKDNYIWHHDVTVCDQNMKIRRLHTHRPPQQDLASCSWSGAVGLILKIVLNPPPAPPCDPPQLKAG